MATIDCIILLGTLLFIVLYGTYKTRAQASVTDYVSGGHKANWWTIGLSVMATQASASANAAIQAHAKDKLDIELVKEIRQRLADGTFEIDYNKVAGNLLGDAVAAVRAGRR